MVEYYLHYVTTTSFQIPSNVSIIGHPNIRLYIAIIK